MQELKQNGKSPKFRTFFKETNELWEIPTVIIPNLLLLNIIIVLLPNFI